MLLVNFKAWKTPYIFLLLILFSLLFAFFMPQTQKSKNLFLYDAVVENNVTKAKIWINKGAEVNILLPKGFPLISLAIEYENIEMLKLLMLKRESLSKSYVDNYSIIDHASQKQNKKLLELLTEALQRDTQ